MSAAYSNVLHRQPDAEGLAFWVDGINHGLSAAGLLVQFSESAENLQNVAKVIGQGFAYTPYS